MFRILPALIFILFAYCTLRVFNIVGSIPEIIAKPYAASSTPPQDQTPATPPKQETKPAEEVKPASKEAPLTEADKQNILQKKLCTHSQIELLKALSERRSKLDEREDEISLKEKSLGIVSKSIDEKITNLAKLQDEVNSILAKYDEKQTEEIATLVKIYENMKPADAARIFDELQMPILIEVSSRMKEAKLAPILALMSSERAKNLTVEFANRRKINFDNYK